MLLANIKYEMRSMSSPILSHPSSPKVYAPGRAVLGQPGPERFLHGLKDGQVDPKYLIFGFGRRFIA